MQQLIQDIKNETYKQVYLLCGEEAYLRKQYRDKLAGALISTDDTMNYHYYEGKDINPGEIIDLAETMPFLAPRRVIVIENSNWFKSGGEKMAEYITTPAESVVIIFVETQIDKRSKLYKAVKEVGRITEFGEQNEATLKRWIATMLKSEDKIISERACELLIEKAGTDMANIRSELEKVICYAIDEHEITCEAIEAVCTQRVSNRIFDMVAAIAEKRQKEALDMYHDLLTLKEPPMGILALIARQFNLMLQVKELQEKGLSGRSIAERVSLAPFIAAKYERQANKFKMSELKAALKACVAADEAVKTGKLNDVLSIELLIIERSR